VGAFHIAFTTIASAARATSPVDAKRVRFVGLHGPAPESRPCRTKHAGGGVGPGPENSRETLRCSLVSCAKAGVRSVESALSAAEPWVGYRLNPMGSSAGVTRR
jgi:hypothetical protein